MTVDRRPTVTFAVPTKESETVKAVRLLASGRVRIRSARFGRCFAVVFGDSGVYTVRCSHSRWTCTCIAQGDRCSHVAAVKLVVDLSTDPQPNQETIHEHLR